MSKQLTVFLATLGLMVGSAALAGDEPPVRGEGVALPYLEAIHAKVHRMWAETFLPMAESQLPKDHPVNAPSRAVELEVIITSEGKVALVKIAKASGSTDFDGSAVDVVKAAAPFVVAPEELLSDDGKVHVLWTLARDDRRCSLARIDIKVDPLRDAVPMLVAQGREKAAIARIQAADDKERQPAFTKFARAWLDRNENDKELDLQVAEANALAGDPRGAHRLRQAVASSGDASTATPQSIAQGLASLKVPVCAVIKHGFAKPALGDNKPAPSANADDDDAPPRPAVLEIDDKEFLDRIKADETRERVLQLLSEGTDGVCLSFAISVAKDRGAKPGDRALALWSLGHSDSPEGKAAVRSLLADPNPTVRAAAIWAEARQGPSRSAVFRLIPFLRDKSVAVRAAAAAALVRVGGEDVLPQLFQVWREKDPSLFAALAGELADLSGEVSAQMLERLLRKDDRRIRLAAARALAARHDDAAGKALAELAKTSDAELKFLAAGMLAPETRLAAAAEPTGYTWTESFLALARGNGKLAAVDWALAQFPKIEPATRIYLMGTWLVATRAKN
jgi:TonB family protein